MRSQVSGDGRRLISVSFAARRPMPLLIVPMTLFDHQKPIEYRWLLPQRHVPNLPAKADPLRHAAAYASYAGGGENARTPEQAPISSGFTRFNPPAAPDQPPGAVQRAANRGGHRADGVGIAAQVGAQHGAPGRVGLRQLHHRQRCGHRTRWCSPGADQLIHPLGGLLGAGGHPPPETPVRCAPPAKG